MLMAEVFAIFIVLVMVVIGIIMGCAINQNNQWNDIFRKDGRDD